MKITARSLALVLAVAPAMARAEDKTAQRQDDTSTRTVDSKNPDQYMGDARMAAMLHHVNKMEIEAGQKAMSQGKTQDVKDYGRALVADHEKADAKLMSIAQKNHLSVDTLPGADKEKLRVDHEKMAQAHKLQGTDFDHGFAEAMYEGHDHLLTMLSKHRKDIQLADLKQYVDDTTPIIQQHKDLAAKLRGTGSRQAQGRPTDSDLHKRTSEGKK